MPRAMSHTSTAKRQRWAREQARAVLEKHASSGLTGREFAEREGLEPARLSSWRERLGVSSGQRLAASATSIPERAAFVELRAHRPSRIELVLRTGHVLHTQPCPKRFADLPRSAPACETRNAHRRIGGPPNYSYVVINDECEHSVISARPGVHCRTSLEPAEVHTERCDSSRGNSNSSFGALRPRCAGTGDRSWDDFRRSPGRERAAAGRKSGRVRRARSGGVT